MSRHSSRFCTPPIKYPLCYACLWDEALRAIRAALAARGRGAVEDSALLDLVRSYRLDARRERERQLASDAAPDYDQAVAEVARAENGLDADV